MTSNDPINRPVLVFDFGSQYVQLIARRVRDQQTFATIVRHDLSADRVRELNPLALIFSGGPSSVYEKGAPRCDPAILDLGVPVLAICYGMQLVCDILGGRVDSSPAREYGRTDLHVSTDDDLLAGVPADSIVWMSHGDQVQRISPDFIPLATTATCPIAAVKHRTRPVYGVQFHPEVAHTPFGATILANFLDRICQSPRAWRIDAWLENAVEQIKRQVGSTDRVVCGVSGGVDSTVTAALVSRAIGPRAVSIFVDNGLLRAGERTSVIESLGRKGALGELHCVDAADRFLSALHEIDDPQEKRIRIGHVFIDVFRHEAKSIPGARFLAQGTLYPDVIESGGSPDGPAATIKHHHNVGGLPAELGFELIEPLRDLFKDEARKLGTELGLPDELVWRQPFPGPGLAVRCLGAVSPDRLEILRQADAIFLDELRTAGLERQIAQAFAVLLPVKSVGVMGDFRTYENVVALRAVETDDFMTADWSRLPHDLLARTATRIINSVKTVNRVVYDITSKPPGTIEWE